MQRWLLAVADFLDCDVGTGVEVDSKSASFPLKFRACEPQKGSFSFANIHICVFPTRGNSLLSGLNPMSNIRNCTLHERAKLGNGWDQCV